MRIRAWLRKLNYEDVDEKIGEVEALHKASGSKERRNWADVLCGAKDGKPVVIAGVEFPILAAAQRSRNRPVTANAIQRNKVEEFPVARVTGRWPKKRQLPRRARQLAKKSPKMSRARAS